jgi:hypothetical protein
MKLIEEEYERGRISNFESFREGFAEGVGDFYDEVKDQLALE